MFARIKKSGNNEYLQIVANKKVAGKVVQRVIATVGRLDELKEKDRIETLIRSLSRFSEKVLLVLSRAGRYRQVHPEGKPGKGPSPLKVKEVTVGVKRYIVCVNERQARKDAADRQAIVESPKEQLKAGQKNLIGNKGYRKYLTVKKNSMASDWQKIEAEARFDGKWVLTTNTSWSAARVALKYKELWMVEHAFRDIKTTFKTRPIFHRRDETIRGHVFCSFLALNLRKELMRRLDQAGHCFE